MSSTEHPSGAPAPPPRRRFAWPRAQVSDTRRDVRRILGRFRPSPPWAVVLFLLAFLLALALSLWASRQLALTPAAVRMFFILVFAALLWLSEAIPAFAVGLLVIALEILLLGRPGGVYAETSRDWENFVLILGHPLIWLFFGGFVIAAGIAKTRLDRTVARWVMTQFGAREASLLAGVMALAFVFSMFMSNTATAAMMVAMMQPVLGEQREPWALAKALLLGVALGASLGGMATLIGSPPHAIAAGGRNPRQRHQLSAVDDGGLASGSCPAGDGVELSSLALQLARP